MESYTLQTIRNFIQTIRTVSGQYLSGPNTIALQTAAFLLHDDGNCSDYLEIRLEPISYRHN